MRTPLVKHFPHPAWLLVLTLLLCGAGPSAVRAQKVDLNGNGMSDIWELMYGAQSLNPGDDTDGDGVSNQAESTAGTNPFDANSAPKITVSGRTGTNFSVTMPCAWGKQYQLQSTTDFSNGTGSNWVVEASSIPRAGSTVTLTASASDAAKFFRIAIADVDSDGDGVNDWEEYQLGLDPFNPTSNGQLDSNGQLLRDYPYVTGRLASQNVITISATDPVANQPDPGQLAVNSGVLTVTRGGFPLNAITVKLNTNAAAPGVAVEGLDHVALPRSVYFPVGVSSQTITVLPLANTNRLAPVVATLNVLPGTGYTVGSASSAGVVIYPSATPSGNGLTAQYYTNSSSTYSSNANFNPANLRLTRVDPVIDYSWSTNTLPITNSGGYYCVRWTGQVQPQYSETYYFDANTDDGLKLWINDQLIIDHWVGQSAADSVGTITLQGGVKYDLRMDYFNGVNPGVAHLYWYSPSQAKQVIPQNRLYSTSNVPSAVVSPLTAIAFLNVPFSYTNAGANSATSFTATGLPPLLTNNPVTGVISGTPTVAGDFQVTLTASNSYGVGASVLDLQVVDTSVSAVTREVWTGVPGSNIADIPVGTPATLTNSLLTLEGITGYGVNYGERIRGYVIPPTSGNYYFWIAGSDSAELWISNDNDPVNKVRRAWASGTASRQWNLQTQQRSGWLTLVAGQRYYVEILHKAAAGGGDNWAVGWLQDLSGTNTTPAAVVPNYVLSPYFPPPPSIAPGTLYAADLVTAPGVTNMGVGSATLRLSADQSRAVLNFNFSGVPSAVISEHIVNDPYNGNPTEILFDISAARAQPDGSYVWPITAVGPFSASDVLNILNQGAAYLTILTADYPNGELNGHFKLVNGVQNFIPPPAPPSWVDDHANASAAARFLNQATFGPNPTDVALVQSIGYAAWISNQFNLPTSHHLPLILANGNVDPEFPYLGSLVFNTWWQQSITAPDQLRQRVAFALSEIMVVSDVGVLQDNGRALSSYYDTLLDNAFGNYRALLKAVTLTPAMGMYLNMQGNDVGSIVTGIHANENYAREIQQLFSIGLNRLWPDGTLVLNAQGSLVPTYDQNVIMGFASVFTGWNYYQVNTTNSSLLPRKWNPPADYIDPMVLVPTHHETGTKLLLDSVMLPPATGLQTNTSSTNLDGYCSAELESALDSIFNHPNVGPFICRQLIQRLVTSTPSPGYLYRVVQAFNNDGAGVRGDLQAVINAILLDYEARSSDLLSATNFGKQREPLLKITAPARAFMAPSPTGGTYSESGTQTITVTTTNAHRLNSSDVVFLSFTDPSGQTLPSSQSYSVTVTSPTAFTITPAGLTAGLYGQTNGVITVTNSSHGLAVGWSVYLNFSTGASTSGVYQVVSNLDSSHFTVATTDMATNFGNVVIPKWSGGGYVWNKTNVTIYTAYPHNLSAGNSVFINFTAAGSPSKGLYPVTSVIDATHFTIIVTNSASSSTSQDSETIYPLVAPPLVRSGTVGVTWSTFNLGATDTGSSMSLAQTPLNSPTVFNFFFPDYQFPGALTTAGLTTPEFQLTSDTTLAWQMNFIEGGLFGSNSGNTNGMSSFNNGGGAIVLDLGPWMTPAYTSNAGLSSLVDALNSLLCGGQLSAAAKTQIVNYASTLAYTTPTYTQMRDRVRAVTHLILTSPDFNIQR
jgi:hypothetical protein